MSVNPTGAIGYEAKTLPNGNVQVTYKGKTTVYKNYEAFAEGFKKQYDAEHHPVTDQKGTTVQANPDDQQLTPEQKAKRDAAHNKELQMQNAYKDLAKASTAMAEAKTPEERAEAQKLLDAANQKLNELTKNTPTGLSQRVDAGDMELDPSGNAHLKVPTQEEIDRFGKDYTAAGAGGKKQAHANLRKTFGQSHADSADIDKTKKALEAAKKRLKADEEAYNKQRKATVGHRGKNFTGDNVQKTQDAYDKLDPNREQITAMKGKIKGEEIARDIAEGRRDRTVRRMRKHIEKAKANMQRVHDIDYAVPNKAAKKAFLAAHPDVKPEQVSVLNKKERNASMVMMLGAANRVNNAIEKYNKSHSEADKKLMDETIKKYGPYLEAFGAKKDEKTGRYTLSGQEQLVIKAKPYQEALANLSGKDFEFNIDEVQAIHDQTGLSKHAIRSTVKEYGFGAENKNWLPWVAALGTAATVGLLENLFDHKKVAESHAHDERTSFAEASDTQTVTVEIPGRQIKYIDPETGEEIRQIIKGESATATASAYASTYAHSVADASARAVAKIPYLSRLAGPVGAGIAAFIAAKPEARDVFNGNVEAVLNDLNLVKGTEAKAFVYQIQNMEFVDGNGEKLTEQQANVIKAAVLKAAMGGDTKKMNETELAAAFLNLQETQKQIKNMKIEPLPEPEKEPDKPQSQPTECPVDLDSTPVQYIHKRKAGDTWSGLVQAYYPDCLKGENKHSMSDCIRELKRQLAYDDEGNFHKDIYQSLLKGYDIPKELKMPEKIFDCEINKDAKVKPQEIVHGNVRGKVLAKAGRKYNHATMQSCKDNEPTNAPEGTVVKTGGKTFKVVNGKWVEQK